LATQCRISPRCVDKGLIHDRRVNGKPPVATLKELTLRILHPKVNSHRHGQSGRLAFKLRGAGGCG
jgi:hypothetical protein